MMRKVVHYCLLLSMALFVFLCQVIPVSAVEDQIKAVLQDQAVYRVGYSTNHAPFSYIDDHGYAQGMAVEVMNYIATEAEISVEYVPLNRLLPGESVDINLAILEEEQLEDNCISSKSYMDLMLMMLGNRQLIQDEGGRVGHLDYVGLQDQDVVGAIPGCEPVAYTNYAVMHADFENGGLDCILTSNLVAQQSDLLVDTAATLMMETQLKLPVSMMFHKHMDKAKRTAFNAVIGGLNQGTKYNVMLNAALVGVGNKLSFWDFIRVYQMEILLIWMMFMILVACAMIASGASKRKALLKVIYWDKVTGLMTAQKFAQEGGAILAKAKPGENFYLYSMDVDNFKYINETHGYSQGTETIAVMAKAVKACFPDALCVARPVADNFLVLLPTMPGENCNQKICTYAMENGLGALLGTSYKLTTSAGIYVVSDPTADLSYMADCVNIARRQGKGHYGHTAVLFTNTLELEMRRKNDISASMELALLDQEFQMYYQPQIAFQTGELVGAESLVRWHRPDGSQVYPDQFIDLFEKNGFICQLDYYVVDQVCQFVAANPHVPKISVNLSGYSFLEPDLLHNIMAILDRNGVKPQSLEIEITESAIVTEYDIIAGKIHKLRALGFSVAMDDFGSGLSSLNRLKDMAIDVIKIDKVFLGDEILGVKGTAILDSILATAQRLAVTTVAEGVETGEQVRLLQELHCDIAQGFHFSRPLPANRFLAFVESYQPNQ